MEWILFFYNSLPDLPSGCPFFSKHIMHRDFVMCNPTNTGHYKYPRFESLSYDKGCHEREVRSFLSRSDPEKYVVFYTRHTDTYGVRKNKVVGYFKVGKLTADPLGFIASHVVLLSKNHAIPIPYAGRGVPTSWGNAEVKWRVNEILRDLMSATKHDISIQYQRETRKVMKMLDSKAGRNEMLETCQICKSRASCYCGRKSLSQRKKILSELYGRKQAC